MAGPGHACYAHSQSHFSLTLKSLSEPSRPGSNFFTKLAFLGLGRAAPGTHINRLNLQPGGRQPWEVGW